MGNTRFTNITENLNASYHVVKNIGLLCGVKNIGLCLFDSKVASDYHKKTLDKR